MMNRLFALTLSMMLVACGNQSSQQEKITTDGYKPDFIILALGDSLTEGLGVSEKDNYPSLLQNALADKNIKVINAGLSAETTSGLKNRLQWVLQQHPDLTILTSGANDAMRGIDLQIIKNNLGEIIAEIQKSGSDVILAGMQIYENLGDEYVNGFKNIYPQLAKEYNVPLIPFFLDHVAGITKLNQADLLHPTAEGYNIIVEKNILPVVNEYLDENL